MRQKWSACLSLSLGLAWAKREEAIWLFVPTIALVIRPLFNELKTTKGLLLFSKKLAPLFLGPAFVALLSYQNYRSYEYFGITELRDESFLRAYGALTRVLPHHQDSRIPASKEARENAYKISQSFRELQPHIESGTGEAYMKLTEFFYGIPASESEIGGAFMIWVLREAVQRHINPDGYPQSKAFYDKLSQEIDLACDSNELNCIANRETTTPPLNLSKNFLTLIESFLRSVKTAYSYTPSLTLSPSIGNDQQIMLAEILLNQSSRSSNGTISKTQSNKAKAKFWSITSHIYNIPIKMAAIASALYFLAIVIKSIFKRAPSQSETPVVASAIVAVLCNTTIVALINTLSWDAIKAEYLCASTLFTLIPILAILQRLGNPKSTSSPKK